MGRHRQRDAQPARAASVFLRGDTALYGALVRWTTAFPYASAAALRGSAADLGPQAAELPQEQVARVRGAQHVPLAVARRMSEVLDEGRRRGYYAEYVQLQLDQNVQLLIDYLGGCERIHKTPMPFAYMLHLRRALVLYCFSLPLALVDAFGWATVPATFVVAYLFFGIEEIGVEIEDPFGNDDNDLPLERICDTIQKNLTALLPDEGARPGQSHPLRATPARRHSRSTRWRCRVASTRPPTMTSPVSVITPKPTR
ncbi:bestrophin family protein [Cystobacter fuscus]